jgi:hypothetical protein
MTCFEYEKDAFILLDGNLDQWNISGDQLTFLDTSLTGLEDKSIAVETISLDATEIWSNYGLLKTQISPFDIKFHFTFFPFSV